METKLILQVLQNQQEIIDFYVNTLIGNNLLSPNEKEEITKNIKETKEILREINIALK